MHVIVYHTTLGMQQRATNWRARGKFGVTQGMGESLQTLSNDEVSARLRPLNWVSSGTPVHSKILHIAAV